MLKLNFYSLLSPFIIKNKQFQSCLKNRISKNCEKRCGESSQNNISFNKKVFFNFYLAAHL